MKPDTKKMIFAGGVIAGIIMIAFFKNAIGLFVVFIAALIGFTGERKERKMSRVQEDEVPVDEAVDCRMDTEIQANQIVEWEQIEVALQTLDDPLRGDRHRESVFVTVCFGQAANGDNFMQCTPKYVIEPRSFKEAFTKSPGEYDDMRIFEFIIEVCKNGKIYSMVQFGKEQMIKLFYNYYQTRKLPDVSNWTDGPYEG